MPKNPIEKRFESAPPLEEEPLEEFREKLTKNLQTTLESLSGDKKEEEIGLFTRTSLIRKFVDRGARSHFYSSKGREEKLRKRPLAPESTSTELGEEFSQLKKEFWEAQKECSEPPLPKNAVEQSIIWNSSPAHIRGKIFDGFISTGGHMVDRGQLDEKGGLGLKRKIEQIVVDRERDRKLSALCEWAKELKDKLPDEEERTFRITQRVFKEMGGDDPKRYDEVIKMELEGKNLLLGEVKYGNCRHRSPLFQVLAVEADLDTVLKKGFTEDEYVFGGHEWNEVTLKNGEIIIVDVNVPPGGEWDKKAIPGKRFDELDFKEFKDIGGFPEFGSNRLSHFCYRDKGFRFIGGRLGKNGLQELLEKEKI